jgi:hypothetical protein
LRVVEEVHLRGHDREGVHTQPEPLITLLGTLTSGACTCVSAVVC